ncbi:helix-hairpin-helix domain-containing protein [Arthrobacter sp. UYEF20]|uniref:ComEA family DNA-binding protein n=1 Tax=Arthrobacter sp. UYEF20 TaxID=1756363 RepID=UPI0033987C21
MSRRSLPRRNQPRRKPGAELPAGLTAARHRLSATLGGPEAAGRPAGLLDLPPADDAFEDQRGGMPSAGSGLRRRTGLRSAALLGAVAAVLGGWFWWRAATGAPEVVPLSEVSSAGVQQPDTGPGVEVSPSQNKTGGEAKGITVHVAGAVARPGVVELPAGSRLHEAIAAAGGPTGAAAPDRLNLAAVLEDGQKIVVPELGQPDASSGQAAGPEGSGSAGAESADGSAGTNSADGSVGTGGGKINLNTAGVEELGTLPRVGPVLAQRIVDWRKQHGRFQTVEELDAVDGVGPKLLETLLPLVQI